MKNEQAVVYREMPILTPLARADLIINIAKLKSHTLTVYSGAVKNLYGAIPGLLKAELHFRFQSREAFADMLVDIAETVAPQLSIMDGVWGMEGEARAREIQEKWACCWPRLRPMRWMTLQQGCSALPGRRFLCLRQRKSADCWGRCKFWGETAESCRVENFVRASDSDGDFAEQSCPAGWPGQFRIGWRSNQRFCLMYA